MSAVETPSSLLVNVNNISKSFESFKALDDVSLTIKKGELVALLGRNGAGKSTLISCIMGFLINDAGTIDIMGKNVLELPREIRSRTGFVPQKMEGFQNFKVKTLLRYIDSFYDKLPPIDPELIRWADLREDQSVKRLSGGQRQRLAILIAMRHDPELLILDEPVASLDPHARRDFMNLLESYARRTQASILISSHILSDLERIASRLVFLRNGKLILDVDNDTFHHATRWVQHEDSSLLESELERIPDIQPLGFSEHGILIHGWRNDLLLPEGTQVLPPDFEDAFLIITDDSQGVK